MAAGDLCLDFLQLRQNGCVGNNSLSIAVYFLKTNTLVGSAEEALLVGPATVVCISKLSIWPHAWICQSHEDVPVVLSARLYDDGPCIDLNSLLLGIVKRDAAFTNQVAIAIGTEGATAAEAKALHFEHG